MPCHVGKTRLPLASLLPLRNFLQICRGNEVNSLRAGAQRWNAVRELVSDRNNLIFRVKEARL
jgi:hypothetical protein